MIPNRLHIFSKQFWTKFRLCNYWQCEKWKVASLLQWVRRSYNTRITH